MRLAPLALLLVLFAGRAGAEDSTRDRLRLETLIAALTDSRSGVHKQAMQGLIAYGRAAMPELQVLSKDPDPQLRARVAQVLSGIGGTRAGELLALMIADRDDAVRQTAAIGLGAVGGPEAYALLRPLLADPAPGNREAAALALGVLGDPRGAADLASWEQAGPEPDRLKLAFGSDGRRQLDRVRSAMRTSLEALLLQPRNVEAIGELLGRLDGERQAALCTATGAVGDPRLSPALAALLVDDDAPVRASAASSLAANGDSRALEALCRAAAEDDDAAVREAAARTLRRLTGYEAAPGPAWSLWWSSHADGSRALAERDRFIAELHDGRRLTSAEELARFSPEQLMPLVDGVLGSGASWWGPLALRALRLDDPGRWTAPLLARYDRADGEAEQVGLVVLLDELGDPLARPALGERLRALRRAEAEARKPYPLQGSLRAALDFAVDD